MKWIRQGKQEKRWEDNIREWTGLEFAKSQRVVENREKKMKETGCEIICGAPTTPLMMEFARSQRAVENMEKRRKLVANSSVVP